MLKKHKHLSFLIVFLTLVGSGIFLYKYYVLGIPIHPASNTLRWTVEAKLSFQAKRQPVKLQFSIPEQQTNFANLKENFISPNYGIQTNVINGTRYAIWTTPFARGSQILYYRLELTPTEPNNIDFKLQTADQITNEPELTAAKTILSEAQKKSADAVSLASQIVKILNNPNNENTSLLLRDDHTEKHIAEIASQLLSTAKIPSSAIQGLLLNDDVDADLRHWLSLRADGKTVFINPSSGEENLPKEFLIWHIGHAPFYTIKGGKNLNLKISKSPKLTKPLNKNQAKSKLLEFSLDTLPIRSQNIYHILLTIPFGALIILLFRNYIGLATFGTFMPVLIALALIEMNIFWGIFLFSMITSFGLIVRFYLERLELLMVPRLSAILVCIVLFIAFFSVITHKLGLDQGSSAALFPIVILTMTIERMCSMWEEQGPTAALKNGLGSLFVASISSMIMANESLQFILFNFPETNLLTLALILLLGQYRGYRLAELPRFKVLAE